jgi:hypothetical protein
MHNFDVLINRSRSGFDDIMSAGLMAALMGGSMPPFAPGERVERVNGVTFSNDQRVATVDRSEGSMVWLKETNSYLERDKLKAAGPHSFQKGDRVFYLSSADKVKRYYGTFIQYDRPLKAVWCDFVSSGEGHMPIERMFYQPPIKAAPAAVKAAPINVSEPIQRTDGLPAEILMIVSPDKAVSHNRRIVVRLTNKVGEAYVDTFTMEGKGGGGGLGIMNVPKPVRAPKVYSGWVNVAKSGVGEVGFQFGLTHATKAAADALASKGRIACIEVSVTEGQGL